MAPPNGIEQFWSKVDRRGPDECWPWTGGRDLSSYGIFYIRGKRTRAHRWLLGYMRGKPLTREVVGLEDGCHHCDNPPCCNPAHLYVGTRKQNMDDEHNRLRSWQSQVYECPQGHPYPEFQRGGHRRCRTCENAHLRSSRRAARTHCLNGHQLAGDNVAVGARGRRRCLTCEARRIANLPKRTHCVSGRHELVGANVMTDSKGRTRCYPCKLEADRERYMQSRTT